MADSFVPLFYSDMSHHIYLLRDERWPSAGRLRCSLLLLPRSTPASLLSRWFSSPVTE